MDSHVNALLWARRTVPDQVASGLQKAGIPLVLIGGSHPEADSVESNFNAAAAAVADVLVQKNCKSLLSLVQEDWIEEEVKSITGKILSRMPDFSETNLNGDVAEIHEWLKNNPPPDVLAVHGTDLHPAIELLRMYGIENQCAILLLEYYSKIPAGFRGITLSRDISAMANAGAELLKKRLSDWNRPQEKLFVNAKTAIFK